MKTDKLKTIAEKLKGKEIILPTDLIGACLFLIIGIILMFTVPSQVVASPSDIIDGRVFPRLLFGIMISCSVFMIIQNIVKMWKKQPVAKTKINLLTDIKALIIFAILLVSYLIAKITDIFVLGAIFCSVSFLLFFQCKRRLYYIITVGTVILIWVAFRVGLGVRF